MSEHADPGQWLGTVLNALPGTILDRNAAISSIYAKLFLLQPDLFYWAGMAAFASFRAGLLLAIYDYCNEQLDTAPQDAKFHTLLDEAELLSSLELIRRTNNDVFRSAGVAHLAYLSHDWDLSAIAATLNSDWQEEGVKEGFALIDEGRQRLKNGDQRGRELVRRGNIALLRHEQWVTVERHFRESPLQLGLLMSIATSMDFDGNHLRTDRASFSSFYRFMLLRRPWVLLLSLSGPDMTNLTHRWCWIEKGILPIWERQLRGERSVLLHRLSNLAQRTRRFDLESFFQTYVLRTRSIL